MAVLTKKSLKQLSKTVSHALRHEPWLYELELDECGWVSIEELLPSLRKLKDEWKDIGRAELLKMISQSSKKRYELSGDKIRALYGHSIPGKLVKQKLEPPEFLYHGTSLSVLKEIKNEGLLPMSRQYVHLSTDIETAQQVGFRKTREPVILKINAKKAYDKGINFYIGNEHVWLADYIPSEYIVVM